MKYKYIYIVLLAVLFLAPMFVKDRSHLIFQIFYSLTCFTFSFLAWRQNKKMDAALYIFLFIVSAVQAFDKEDNYFFVQIILLVLFFILVVWEWRQRNNESGAD
ncbi:heme O synthase-like polyprenyltransferase [Chryseobacterium sp. H1D6B]|uniref:hypothetical protein n=1 Tax=Chryseobacterium sp. H1D6B TaxID=2940588 RepID=UPI0015C89F0F|nr:hypothetical protein [Chryseobacterium sp. H1D6B]MDH6250971.1 heme O synthase-like polyprenyltransferase [Chryseobacterium sp. H1D6B]